MSDQIEPTQADKAVAELRTKLRMIVSHASGGSSQDIDASVNDICVCISANRNLVYVHGKEVGLEDAAKVADEWAAKNKEALARARRIGRSRHAFDGDETQLVMAEQIEGAMHECLAMAEQIRALKGSTR